MLNIAQPRVLAKWRRPRDTQRKRLYLADDVLKPFAKPMPEVADIERFVRYVWGLERVRKSWPTATGEVWRLPIVRPGAGCRSAFGSATGITMPRWSRKTDVVIHELAHCITDREWGSLQVPGHGWHFCQVYLRLVLLVMGREAHDAFKASMKTHKVRFTRPRTRAKGPAMTTERRAQLVAQLAAAREKRYAKVS